jgi:hypothetical protein
LVEALQAEPHLASLSESIHKTISREHGQCHLVLSVEEEPPVSVDYAPVTDVLAVAHLTRAKTTAVLVMVAAPHSRLIAPDLDKLQAKLSRTYPQADFAPLFTWIFQTKPPLATTIYLNEGEPDTGIDTACTCIAAAFFRLRSKP